MQYTVLGSIALGYQPLWDRSRDLCGVRLFVQATDNGTPNAAHLLEALNHLWSGARSALLVSPRTPALLCDLLDHVRPDMPGLEINDEWLGDAAVVQRVQAALAQGCQLVWQGRVDARPAPAIQSTFAHQVIDLGPESALQALRAAQAQHPQGGGAGAAGAATAAARTASPIQAAQVYDRLPSGAMVDHALDQQGAAAVAGWPVDDVMHEHRQHRTLPRLETIQRMMRSLGADEAMEYIETILSEDPALTYRFLNHVNSAALGRRTGIDSLRHGLMMLGYTSLQHWLRDQLAYASVAVNLKPVFSGMVLRAKLVEHLLDAGAEGDLQRELYLCGLLSQLDVLLGEPLPTILARLPLHERVQDAILRNDGPYAPYLSLAHSMETADTAQTLALCAEAELPLEEANRILLRMLDGLMLHRPLWADDDHS